MKPKKFDSFPVYLPQCLELEDTLKENPPEFSVHNDKPYIIRDRMAYIVGLYFSRYDVMCNKYDSTENPPDRYVSFHSVIMQSWIRNYKEYFSWLIKNDIFESDNRYEKGKKAIGYRVTNDYFSSQFKEVYILDPVLVKKYNKWYRDFSPSTTLNVDTWNDTKSYLRKCFDSLTLSHEIKPLTVELLRLKQRHLFHSKLRPEKVKTNIKETFRQWRYSCERMFRGRIGFIRDEVGMRLHTNVSNLKKEFRTFLRYNGEALVEVDICNSQPYLLCCLFTSNTKVRQSFLNELFMLNSNLKKKSNESMPLAIRRIESGKTLPSDVIHWKQIVAQGQLYEYFQSTLSKKFHKEFSRKEVKRMFIKLLFQPANQHSGHLKDLFQGHFPSIYDLIIWANTGFIRTKRQGRKIDEQRCSLAILLQRVEAHFILDTLCPKLIETYPDEVPLFTIHDSVLTTKDYVTVVEKKLRQMLVDATGVECRLRVTFLDS